MKYFFHLEDGACIRGPTVIPTVARLVMPNVAGTEASASKVEA